VGGVVLLLGAVVLLIVNGRAILGVISQGTLIATVAVILFGLLVGHLLGRPDPGNRGALAGATVFRHPAIALLLAAGAFTEREATVLGAVLMYRARPCCSACPMSAGASRSRPNSHTSGSFGKGQSRHIPTEPLSARTTASRSH